MRLGGDAPNFVILKKYKYQFPHLDDQVINRYIKEIAQAAGLAENLKVVKKLTDKYYYFK